MKLAVGDTFSKTREVTDSLVRAFAEVAGDFNPIHLDDEFAKSTRFAQRIAHGMLSGAFISGVLGYEMGDAKVIYLSQNLKFTAPVFIGDSVTTTATVASIRVDKGIITIETICTNQRDEVVVEGEAVVMLLND